MKLAIYAAGIAIAAATAFQAEAATTRLKEITVKSTDRVSQDTITGYSASVAYARGLPLTVAPRPIYDRKTLDKANDGPVTRYTITGYAASAAVAEGVPLNPVGERANGALKGRAIAPMSQTREILMKGDRAGQPRDRQQSWESNRNEG
ncbi:hypothetical protein [Chenggangzhangella methanolivorans]|uniref:Uncharacterized protein n=1 Tax=Chenggangzhangella methanolivorans TaxID=1437009 RepID=A0A9E6RBH5_9HYPH|nr:hypothetical protein [Chenggangzhangella methanolivorans]QZO01706.1 hypothetical protein K6K41_10170 [Chenggangzhangella methanolivorans]